jgi:protein SCO1/2
MMNQKSNILCVTLSVIVCNLVLTFCTGATHAQALRNRHPQPRDASRKATEYACPMHPEVVSKSPGRCPKCGMDLKVLGGAKARPAASVEPTMKSAVENGTLRIPDITVYDQQGQRRNFYSDLVKGKTVAINFIFTTCKTVCPPLTATFRKVQQGLGERVGRDIEMISISVDPTTDVPERLKEFSEKFKAGPGWTFVTGDKMEIDKLLKALGASVPDDKSNHTSLILIGNAAMGNWTRTYGLASAATILQVIKEAADNGKSAVESNNGATAATGDARVTVPPPPVETASRDDASRQGARRTPVAALSKDAGQGESSVASRQQKLAASASKYFPNLVLVNQDNQPMRFYDQLLKGKTVLINFMLTHCTGACSPMTANLVKVQKYLGEQVGKDVIMISISVDPEHDTPEALKKYAEGFKVQPGWYFLTGKRENINGVLSKLGAYTEDPQQHSTVLIIGDEATGQWMKVPALARPSEIAEAVTKILSVKKETAGQRSTGR